MITMYVHCILHGIYTSLLVIFQGNKYYQTCATYKCNMLHTTNIAPYFGVYTRTDLYLLHFISFYCNSTDPTGVKPSDIENVIHI
jgi:hypothetical protein